MMNYKTASSFAVLILILLLSSCKETTPQTTTINDTLKGQIENSIPGGVQGLILPNSNDYYAIPNDPKNHITEAKVKLGQMLYHETGLGIQPENMVNYHTYSCATCHSAAAGFQSGLKQGIGEGGEGYGSKGELRRRNTICDKSEVDVQPIRTPSAMNGAYQKVQLWNGQFGATGVNKGTESKWMNGNPISNNHLGYEGLETQAIAGFGVHRMGVDKSILMAEPYRSLFEKAFPDIPENARYTAQVIGLAIAAYERTLLSNKAPFQLWLKGDEQALTPNQLEGVRLFFSKAECFKCHAEPALNSMNFYALGMEDLSGANVIGNITDAVRKGRGGFTGNSEDDYKFKVPQLYNLKDVNFLGHGGSFSSVREVILYKNNGVPENGIVPNDLLVSDFHALGLEDYEIDALVDFVENGLYDPDLERYEPTLLPSGYCFPNNDSLTRIQRGCN